MPRGAVAVSLTLVLVWNAASLGLVTLPASSAVPADPEMNRWDMFVPPPESDGWYVVPGRLASGEQVDAFHGGPVRWSPGGAAEGMYPGHRWYVYLQDLKRPPYRSLRRPFAAHLCQRWNATHQDGLVELSVFYVQEPVATSDREPTRRIHFLDHSCAAPG